MPAAPPLVTLTAEQALQAVCTAVATVIAPTPLILGKTDQVGPSGPTVYLWPVSDVGVGYVGSLYGAILTTAYDVRQARYQLSGYGVGMDVVLRRLRRHLQVATATRKTLTDAGVAPQRILDVRDLTTWHISGEEPRYTLDMVAQYVASDAPPSVDDVSQIVVDLATEGALVVDIDGAVVVP